MANRAARGAGGVILACVLFGAVPAAAQDAVAGREKAKQCVLCHGELGIAEAPDAPNLAGENAVYIAGQLKAFRDGARVHEQMSIIAADLTDEDIADLARWYALIEVTATAPVLE